MTNTIFCTNNHVVLDAPRCEKCGWVRPAALGIGQPAWPAVDLLEQPAGSAHALALAAISQGMLVIPLKNHELVGLEVGSGRERWRIRVGEGLAVSRLYADGGRILAGLADERGILSAGQASLVEIDPQTGLISEIWKVPGHDLSLAVVSGRALLVRVTNSSLYALKLEQPGEQLWKVVLATWWTKPALVHQDKVYICDGQAMLGEGYLLALALTNNGSLLWRISTDGLLVHAPVAWQDCLVIQNGRKKIQVLDAAKGGLRWEQLESKIYTAPVLVDGLAVYVARGPAADDEVGRYLLKALDLRTGKISWQVALPERVQCQPLYVGGLICLAGDDGNLLVYRPLQDAPVFTCRLGGEEDPFRMELLAGEGLLFAATYTGRLHAIVLDTPGQQLGLPADYLARGEFEQAAEAYALGGNYSEAARLYAGKIGDLQKALALCERFELDGLGAELASQAGLFHDAVRFYERSGDLPGQAEMLLRLGDTLAAARVFEKHGDLGRAARLFEQAESYNEAGELYTQLKEHESLLRISAKFTNLDAKINTLVMLKRLDEAAQLAFETGRLRLAVDLFQQAGQPEQELNVLLRMQESQPEEWANERIAELARKTGRFLDEARACERFKNQPQRAAEAYFRAARQAEQVDPDNHTQLGELFRTAGAFFERAGLKPEAHECRERVIRYLRLPNIFLESVPRNAFIEDQRNILEMLVHNTGSGIACNIQIDVTEDFFWVDRHSSSLDVGNLAAGTQGTAKLYLRPKPGEVGIDPLILTWTWNDQDGNSYKDHVNADIPVRAKSETRPDSTPQIIHINTLIQGDQFSGDKLATGAQKQVGDKVEINDNAGPPGSISAGLNGSALLRFCPVCKLPTGGAASFCNECGAALG